MRDGAEASGLQWEAKRRGSSHWEPVSFVRYEWRLLDDRGGISETVVESNAVESCCECDETWKFDSPSIAFVILPRKERDLYYQVFNCVDCMLPNAFFVDLRHLMFPSGKAGNELFRRNTIAVLSLGDLHETETGK